MPDIVYEQVAAGVRRARVAETEAERLLRQRLEAARSRLAHTDALPAAASAVDRIIWERLRALEELVQNGRG